MDGLWCDWIFLWTYVIVTDSRKSLKLVTFIVIYHHKQIVFIFISTVSCDYGFSKKLEACDIHIYWFSKKLEACDIHSGLSPQHRLRAYSSLQLAVMAMSQQSLPPVNQYTEIILCDWPAFARAQALCMIRWFHHVRITTPCGVSRFRLCRPWSGRKATGLDQGWQQRATPCACITGRNSYLSSPCVMQTRVVPSIPAFDGSSPHPGRRHSGSWRRSPD